MRHGWGRFAHACEIVTNRALAANNTNPPIERARSTSTMEPSLHSLFNIVFSPPGSPEFYLSCHQAICFYPKKNHRAAPMQVETSTWSRIFLLLPPRGLHFRHIRGAAYLEQINNISHFNLSFPPNFSHAYADSTSSIFS